MERMKPIERDEYLVTSEGELPELVYLCETHKEAAEVWAEQNLSLDDSPAECKVEDYRGRVEVFTLERAWVATRKEG